VPTATGPTEGPLDFEVGAVFTRLGPQTALVAYFNHNTDYVPAGPDFGSISALHLGIATLNAAGDTWQAGTLIEIPPTGGLNVDFPLGFVDGQLVLQAFDGAGMSLYVLNWNASTSAFGAPAIVTPPSSLTIDDVEVIEFRDGHMLAVLADQPTGPKTSFVASADNGWVLTELILPPNSTVPVEADYAGWVISELVEQGRPELLFGGRVAVQVTANEPSPGTGSAELLAWFVPAAGGTWSFEVHPIYTEYLAVIGAPNSPMQVSMPRSYQNHYAFTIAAGNAQQMVRVYQRHLGGDIAWQRHDTLAGRSTFLQLQYVAGVIERANLPALAAFAFQRVGGLPIELELGILQGELVQNDNGQDERVMTSLVALTVPGLTATGWQLTGVERGSAGRLLVSFYEYSSDSIYTWRVTVIDGATPTASANLVGLTSSELVGATPLAAGAFAVDIDFEPGDGTLASVPGGCTDVASFISTGGAVGGTPGLGTTETQSLQYLGGFDFEAAPGDDGSGGVGYDALRIPYGAANEVVMVAASAPLFVGDATYAAVLPPSGTEGNQMDATGVPLIEPVWQQSVFAGQEALLCDGEPCNKVFYNTAIGFDATVPHCWLQWEATASGGTGVDGTGTIAPGFVYPAVFGNVQLTGADPTSDGLLCTQHPLGSDGMAIAYSQPDMTDLQFCYSWDGLTLVNNLGAGVPCPNLLGGQQP